MKIAIAGGTGFVGTRLAKKLHAEGFKVIILTRDLAKGNRIFPNSIFPRIEIVSYDPKTSGSWQDAIDGCDAVINLAGTPIAEGRWTPAVKQDILVSRLNTTEKIVEAIKQAKSKPSVLINTSAIGYYGTSETINFVENSPSGEDFLGQLCQSWEVAAEQVKVTGTRLVILRFGLVLGQEGGALAKMLTPFKLFAGGPIGTGKQWVSWIHIDDLVNLIIYALKQPEIQGVYNATAPHPVQMDEFSHTLGKVIDRPSWLPVPGVALELLLGDAAIVVLEGQKVLPERTLASGFTYQYPTIEPALLQILRNDN